MDATCIFIGSLMGSQKIAKGFEKMDVIIYRDLCCLMSPPDRSNMDCYRIGCYSPAFAIEIFMDLYNSICVGMSNDIAKGDDQHGCDMHFYKLAGEFHRNRKRLRIN